LNKDGEIMKTIYDFRLKDINNQEISISDFKNKLILVVNVASKCGFTPQYEGLELLYKKYINDLVILGFPCNQFGKQEPGDAAEIKNFCSLNYNVSFPIFSKIDVNGENASEFFTYLKKEAPGLLGTEAIKWNFTKFLIDKSGKVVDRFAPIDTPEKIEQELKQYL
jgi:glutathione peroxidase